MTKILALDVSSVSTGYALLVDGIPQLEYCGKIVMKEKLHGERLVRFEHTILDMLIRHQPDYFCAENIFGGPSIITFKVLSYFHGIIQKLAYIYNQKEPVMLTPSEVRKIIGDTHKIKLQPTKEQKAASGLNSKELTYNFITNHFDLTNLTFKKDNDLTDAISLAYAVHIRMEKEKDVQPLRDTRDTTERKRRGSKKSI